MYFEDYKYFKDFKPYKLEMPFGNFFLCENFFLAEANEGIHLDWDKLKSLFAKVIEFYGKNTTLGFVTNRVNSYSVDPQIYDKVDKEFKIIAASAIVIYSDMSFMNATIEKRFANVSVKRCISLDEAIEWVLNLKEFKKN